VIAGYYQPMPLIRVVYEDGQKVRKGKMKIYIEDNVCTVYKLVLHAFQNDLIAKGNEIVDDPANADTIIK
jgi:hypothetical protein